MSDHELDPGDSERERLLHQVRHLQHEVQRLEGVSGGLASSHASLRQELEAALARATEAEAKPSALTVADAEKPRPGDDRVEPLRRILGVGRALLDEVDQALERLFDHADALDGEFTAAEKECDSRHGGMGVLLIHRQRDEAMKRAEEAERACAAMRSFLERMPQYAIVGERYSPKLSGELREILASTSIGSGWVSPAEVAERDKALAWAREAIAVLSAQVSSLGGKLPEIILNPFAAPAAAHPTEEA